MDKEEAGGTVAVVEGLCGSSLLTGGSRTEGTGGAGISTSGFCTPSTSSGAADVRSRRLELLDDASLFCAFSLRRLFVSLQNVVGYCPNLLVQHLQDL